MAGRIRTLKPEILEDDATATLSDTEWRVFVSLILLADDYGNFRANPKLLDGSIFWASEADRDWSTIRASLSKLVLFWEQDGQLYGHIRNWARHQRVDKPGKPRCPSPPREIREAPANDSRDSREDGAKRPTSTPEAKETSANSQIRETVANDSREPRETLATDLRPVPPTTDHDPDRREGETAPPESGAPPSPRRALIGGRAELVEALSSCPKLTGDLDSFAVALDGIGANVGAKPDRVLGAVRQACAMVLAEQSVATSSHAMNWVRKTATRLMGVGQLEKELRGGDGRVDQPATGTNGGPTRARRKSETW